MTGPDETLTAALRRLADEHASGLLSVATPGRDVVLELADGIPVGIGPTHDVSDRVGREADAELVAAAVVDTLVDQTVAAIVGGGGDWVWDVADDAAMMPVPPGLATELSRRAVDAAQALATLDPAQVLTPARDLETHGEVDRIRHLFDGGRTLEDVAGEAGLTVPATATLAAALVAAGVLSTGVEEAGPMSWTDAVAGSTDNDDQDDDEPELWVMDPPEEDEADEEDVAPAATAEQPAASSRAAAATVDEATVADPAVRSTPEEVEASAEEQAQEPADDVAVPSAAASESDDDGWADTTWLDELGREEGRAATRETTGEQPDDARAALSAMISDLQRPERSAPAEPAPAPPDDKAGPDDGTTTEDKDSPGQRVAPEATRKEPKAAPGEVAEFLRELSRLALDDE